MNWQARPRGASGPFPARHPQGLGTQRPHESASRADDRPGRRGNPDSQHGGSIGAFTEPASRQAHPPRRNPGRATLAPAGGSILTWHQPSENRHGGRVPCRSGGCEGERGAASGGAAAPGAVPVLARVCGDRRQGPPRARRRIHTCGSLAVRRGAAILAATGWLLVHPGEPAAAQGLPAPVLGADVQAAASTTAGGGGLSATFVADTFAAVEWPALKLVARPVSRRLASGEWRHDLYQLAVRYERARPLPLRVEAGYLAPVIGLASLRSRPAQVLPLEYAPHYFVPLPRLEPGAPPVRPVTTPYPLGLVAATGGTRWDVRGGVVDASPVRRRGVIHTDGAVRSPQAVVGGGWSPAAGLRFGATFVRGPYDRRTEGSTRISRTASVTALEVEVERRHTALTGELVRSRFEIAGGAVASIAGFVELRHALSARWTVAGRYDGATAPGALGSRLDTVQAAASFRLTREVAVRAGVVRRRTYYEPWRTAAGASLVVSARRP